MKENSSRALTAAAFLLYLVPALFIAACGIIWLPLPLNWTFFAAQLLAASGGSLILLYLIRQWQPPPLPPPVAPPPIIIDHSEEVDERDAIIEKLLQLAEEQRRQREKAVEVLAYHTEKSQEALEADKRTIEEQEATIATLRYQMEEKQDSNDVLQNKIQDLTYEIKTLLQLADMDHSSGYTVTESAEEYLVEVAPPEEETAAVPPHPSHYTESATSQLKRCINIAQKVTSSHNFGSYNSRFRDLSLDNDALDLRRLCDNLQGESGNTVVVYSQKSRKVLFVNDVVRVLLGWSPSAFTQNFESIIKEGIEEWRSILSQLNTHSHAHSRLLMRTELGHDLLIHYEVGLIPTGIFKNNVIAILHASV